LVRTNIHAQDRDVRVRLTTASRGKHIRAEPVAGLYEKGRVKHAGRFPQLEDQMIQFSIHGYTGDRSPDRADAMVHGLTELAVENKKRSARRIR
jgi:phage terminase large subunit-like protein